MQDACSRAARSAVIFNENSKSSVTAGEESHSDPLRVTIEARTRLRTPAKAAISGECNVQVNPAKKTNKQAKCPRHSRSRCECLGEPTGLSPASWDSLFQLFARPH